MLPIARSPWSMNLTGGIISLLSIIREGLRFPYLGDYTDIDILDPTYEFNTSTANQKYSINFVRGNNSWGWYSIEGNHTCTIRGLLEIGIIF